MNFMLRRTLLFAVLGGATGCAAFFPVPAGPLEDAAARGDVAAIRRIVDAGAEINAADGIGATALYWAARGGHRVGPHICGDEGDGRPGVIAALLDLGADPNVQDRRAPGLGAASGWTPLMVALHHQQFKSARVLLERGADPNILSDQGMSVMTMASAEKAPGELISLMIAKGFRAGRAHRRAD